MVPTKDDTAEQAGRNRRGEVRTILDQYHSVQFAPHGKAPLYQFRLKDISAHGLCILVPETSAVLNGLETATTFEMTYCPPDRPAKIEHLQTRIAHITPMPDGKYAGHVAVGLLILSRSQS